MNEKKADIYKEIKWISSVLTDSLITSGFYFSEAGEFIGEKGYFVQREGRDDYLILYTKSGEGILKLKDRQIYLKENIAVIIDCNEFHEYRTVTQWDFFWIHINGTGVESGAEPILGKEIVLYDEYEFIRLVEKLLEIGADIKNQSEISLTVHMILCKLLSQNKNDVQSGTVQKIDEIVKYIDDNYADQIKIDDMLNIAHVSKYYFIRRFKQYTGVTPYRYLIGRRINASKQLLRSTEMTISQISEICGFLDDSNYIYQFRKYTSQTPSQYRRDFS